MARRDATNAVGKTNGEGHQIRMNPLSTNPSFIPKLSKVIKNVIASDIIAAIAAVYTNL